MKEGWKYEKLGDICDILDSKRKPITKNKRVLGSIPYYGATGVLDYVKDFIFDEKLVLLGEDGAKWAAGDKSAYIISGKSWVNNHAHALRPNRDIITDEYLTYYLNFSDLSGYITGVTVPKLNQEKMRGIEIPLPPLSEQERIVSLLDAEFAKIDAIKANAEKQLQDAKALFQSALKDYLTPKEGWEEKTLKEITSKIGSGATPKGGRKVYIKEGCSLIRSMNVHYGFFKYDDLAHINDEAARQLNGVEIYEDDVLFNITGASIARCCVVPNNILPARVNQHVSILRSRKEMVLPFFLSYMLISPIHQKELLQIGEAGSTRQALTKTNLEEHIVTIPLIEEQHRIMEKIEQLSAKIQFLQSNYDQTITLCNDLKQSILKDIFG